MNRPSATISLRVSQELWEKVSVLVNEEKCKNFSDALRSLIEGGLWLDAHKKELQDPKRIQQLIEVWNKKMNEREIFDWVKQLSDSKKEAVGMALALDRNR